MGGAGAAAGGWAGEGPQSLESSPGERAPLGGAGGAGDEAGVGESTPDTAKKGAGACVGEGATPDTAAEGVGGWVGGDVDFWAAYHKDKVAQKSMTPLRLLDASSRGGKRRKVGPNMPAKGATEWGKGQRGGGAEGVKAPEAADPGREVGKTSDSRHPTRDSVPRPCYRGAFHNHPLCAPDRKQPDRSITAVAETASEAHPHALKPLYPATPLLPNPSNPQNSVVSER